MSGKIGLRAVIYYFSTTIIAVILGKLIILFTSLVLRRTVCKFSCFFQLLNSQVTQMVFSHSILNGVILCRDYFGDDYQTGSLSDSWAHWPIRDHTQRHNSWHTVGPPQVTSATWYTFLITMMCPLIEMLNKRESLSEKFEPILLSFNLVCSKNLCQLGKLHQLGKLRQLRKLFQLKKLNQHRE